MRILDVENLGWDAVRVRIEGERVLLVESTLSTDDRINVMNRVLADVASS